jgi:cellulose synthase/poly-beta-1,6-N-acetylglucosamine synthase-like glycosyltransferase
MITIIITSYNEPKATQRAIETFLKQKSSQPFKVIVMDPFPEVGVFLREKIKDERFEFILDPGEGKPYAMNMLFEILYSENKEDILVFTDGDVYVSDNTLQEIENAFTDRSVGCITGRPVATNQRNTKYGYWAALSYDGIDMVRKKLSKQKKFFQTSGYLFAIRNGLVKETLEDVPEDCVIPYFVWKKGYKIAYLDKAKVHIQYPTNFKDWINQRTRTIKAHENLNKIVPDMPRTKSLLNEIKSGLLFSLTHPKNIKEYGWLSQLYGARLYMYYRSFKEAKLKSTGTFDPGWRENEVQSAKPLD